MSNREKIAFIKMGSNSYTNDSVLKFLKFNFPTFQIDVIDIYNDYNFKKDFKNILFSLKYYGGEILTRKKTLKKILLRNPYIFNKIRNDVVNKLIDQKYTFTFQTQSIFDFSLPEIPHFVYTDHTHLENLRYPAFKKEDLYTKSWIECEKKIYNNATLNFTMSSNILRSIIEDYCCPSEKVDCVYGGSNVIIDENKIFDNNRFFNKNVLFVGVDWERKGGLILVEAWEKVIKIHPDATLIIVGCHPKLEQPQIKIIGKIPISEVNKYYEKASIFCLPTRIEPFGIVFLEAMAHKLPIIGSKIGAIPDFIIDGENGYLVDPDNADQIAEKLIDLLNFPDKCKKFGEFGHQLFCNRYTWEKTGTKISESINKFI